MKVTLIDFGRIGTGVYSGNSLVGKGYLDSEDVLRLLIGKGSILEVEQVYAQDLFEVLPTTLEEFYNFKEGLC